MKVLSTNIGPKKIIEYQGKSIETGIFKSPVDKPIQLEKERVCDDHVADKTVHGGVDKACYLYSTDHYPYWKKLYPELDWQYGMFGENLSVEGLDEKHIFVGDIYEIGTALVQVVQPRQPCYKLGVRFKDKGVIKEFIAKPFSGVYLKVFETGEVNKGDELKLMARGSELSIADVFETLYQKEVKRSIIEKALSNEVLPMSCKKAIQQRLTNLNK